MIGNRCLKCMCELPGGTDVCPHCGYDNSSTLYQGDELPLRQELAGGAYLVGSEIGRTDAEITYIGLKKETGERVYIRELFPSDLSNRTPGFTSIMWRISEEDWGKRRESFVHENRGEGVIDAFFQNNTAYIIMVMPDIPQSEEIASTTEKEDKKTIAQRIEGISKKTKIGIIAGACAAVTAAIILIAVLTSKTPVTGWKYSVEGDHVEITGTELDTDELEIPSVVERLPVTVIADEAFKDNTALVSVTIPDGVTAIHNEVFAGCVNLESVSIPDSVSSIGKSAFQNCESLKAIDLPPEVASIPNAAFSGCGLLERVGIPAGLTSIGEAAFANCTSLRDIILPDSLTDIGDRAFANCVNLTVNIAPATVTHLSATAFEGCTLPEDSLKHTILPTSERGVLTYTVAIEPQYDEVKDFSYNNLAAAKKDGKWGYINKENEVIIPFEYEYACSFNEGYAVVATDRQNSDSGWSYELAFIDVDNNLTQFTLFSESNAWILDDDFDPESMVFHNGYIIFTPAGRTRHFDHFFGLDGKQIDLGGTPDDEYYWAPTGPLNEGLAPVNGVDYYGWVNDEGEVVYSEWVGEDIYAYASAFNQDFATVTAYEYDDEGNFVDAYLLFVDRNFDLAFPEAFDTSGYIMGVDTISQRFGDTGLAMMSMNGKYGAIDKNGDTVIEFTFDELLPDSEGLITFLENGLCGYIDADSLTKVIPAQFEMGTSFNGGFAAVYDGEKAFLINRNGEEIPGTDSLDYSSYFILDDDGDIAALYPPGEYVVIEENGKYGFGHLEYYPDLPESSELSADLYTRAASAIAEELVPVALQNLFKYDITRKDMCALITKSLEKISDMKIEEFVEEQTSTPLNYYIQTNTFQDVYTTAVISCEALNIIMGESEKVFNAYGHVTRQEAAAFLQRTAALLGIRNSESTQVSISDSADVSEYFIDSVQFVVDMDIMDCDDSGAFMPLNNFTREEAFAAVYRLLRVVVEETF